MARTGISDDFELDDHGILRDSFASDFHVDDDGILQDSHIFKHGVFNGAGHGTDSGFGGDKQSSSSTLQHLQTSFEEELAPIGDESINISDFEASRDDDLDSVDGDLNGRKKSRSHATKDLDTPGSTLERPMDLSSQLGSSSGGRFEQLKHRGGGGKGHENLFSEEYYQQLRDLGVVFDGEDFSREESQQEFEALGAHMSQEHINFEDDENRDLIGEYLHVEYEREQAEYEEDGEDGKHLGRKPHPVPNSRASSAPTISGRSFPEISPEDAELMYAGSQATGDEDEIILINHRLLPSSHIHAQKLPVTPSQSRPSSQGSLAQSPAQSIDGQTTPLPLQPTPAHGDVRARRDKQAVSKRGSDVFKVRPDSVASQASAVSEDPFHVQSEPSSLGKSAMLKAKSQESFFEKDKPDGGKTGDKLHKRLLPTPTMGEANQLFRVKSKSKSVSNIANRSMPVKPTHMTISEITRITMEDGEDLTGGDDGALNQSEGELTHQLLQESSRRKQATELVQQLQKEYDSLLSKYALAELTIDQMRLGARITLHADSPTPLTAKPGVLSPKTGGSKAGIMQLPQSAQRAVVLGPSFDALSDGQSVSSAQVQTADFGSLSLAQSEKGQNTPAGPGLQRSEDGTGIQEPATAEAFKLQIKQQATILNDRLDHFHALLETRQLTMEEQEKAFENIRSDHEKLRRTYLQAKEDYKLMRRSGATSEADFDSNKELEGQLFRLGMKFDEVHENVESNLQQQPARRQPFQAHRLPEDKQGGDTSVQREKQVEGKSFSGATADAEFEKRVEHLHEEYRTLMDHYRHLKQSPLIPETAKEMDNVVRKLNGICDEMPDMFRLPPEVQERYERLHNQNQSHSDQNFLDQSRMDQSRTHLPHSEKEGPGNSAVYHEERSSHLSVPHNSSKVHGLPVVGDHSISSYLPGRDRMLAGRHELDDSFRRIPSSLSGSRSSLTGDHNSSITGLRSSITPSPQDEGGRDSPRSLDGAAAPKNREGYDARISRPRRHQHDFRDPKLSKLPDRGSLSSLPDSGISDQEGRERRTDDRLAHLPGPGKMKQMTKQRGDNDMDSGFVGSVVSTGSGAQNINRDYQPEGPLRLKERPPGDRAQNRARLDSSGSSSTIESLQRGSGRSDLPSRKLPTAATLSTQRHQDSIDRSYDAELDESTTLSDGREMEHGANTINRLRPQTSKPSDGKSRQISRRSKDDDGSVSSQNSRSSRSARLHSSSIQEDETLEDFSNEELSTPRQLRPTLEPHAKQSPASLSIQESHSSLLANRPPTPHSEGTLQRPPTPYRPEEKKDNSKTTSNLEEKEDGEEEEGDASADVIQTVERTTEWAMDKTVDKAVDNQVLKTQSHSHQVSKQQVRSRSPAPTFTEAASLPQRPQSRGEPTTDLYHTRRHSHDRSQGSINSAESSKPSSMYSQSRGRNEDRGVGSDIEIRSDVTRGSSVNSARLRALQEEIEKLKEGVRAANDKAERPLIQPLPTQPQHQKDQGPDYYDPFDDPYGFMRIPRRRANSFSGGRVREFDDWYLSLPNGRNEDDIPLGYAAADAYNRHHKHKPPETGRERLRQRRTERERRRRGGEGTLPNEMVEGHIGVAKRGVEGEATGLPNPTTATLSAPAAPTPAHVRRPPVSDPQALYNYYVPTRQGVATSANPYRQHTTPLYSSQPNLAQVLAGVAPDPYQHYASPHQQLQQPQPQPQSQPLSQQQEAKRPWYTIRRSPWSAGAQSVQYLPVAGSGYQQQNLYPQQDAAATVAPEYYYYSSYPSSGSTTPAPSMVGYRTESCPLCGGTGAHIHEDDVEPVNGYIAQDFATQPGLYYIYRRHRRQGRNSRQGQRSRPSRSLSRTRHYSTERSSSRSRYLIREYADSASDDSDFEIVRSRRRSRSLSRSRSQSESRSTSRHKGRRYPRKYDSDEDVDLNQSLLLSEDIGRLTHRMIGTVKGELQRNRDKLSSSHW